MPLLRSTTPTIFLKSIDAVKPVSNSMANHARTTAGGDSDEKTGRKRLREVKSPNVRKSPALQNGHTESSPGRRPRKRQKGYDHVKVEANDKHTVYDDVITDPVVSPASSVDPVERKHSVNSAATDTASSTNGSTGTTTGSHTIGKGCRGLRDLAGLNDLLTPYFHIDSAQAFSGRQQRPPARYAVAAPSDYACGRKTLRNGTYAGKSNIAISFDPSAGTSAAAGGKNLLRVNGKNIHANSLDVDLFAETAKHWRNACKFADRSYADDAVRNADIFKLIDKVELPEQHNSLSHDEKSNGKNRRGRQSPKNSKGFDADGEAELAPSINTANSSIDHDLQNLRWYKLFHARKLLSKSIEEKYRIIHTTVESCLQQTLSTVSTTSSDQTPNNVVFAEKRHKTNSMKRNRTSPPVSGNSRCSSPLFASSPHTSTNTVSPRYIFMNDRHIACQYISHFPIYQPLTSTNESDAQPPLGTSQQHYVQTLYICEYCMTYFRTRRILESHQTSSFACCQTRTDTHKRTYAVRSPPGTEIYRSSDGRHSVFEVSGTRATQYCSHLCLLAKLFLDHKKVCVDIETFNFYVITRNEVMRSDVPTSSNDDQTIDGNAAAKKPDKKVFMHFIGYFSKELHNPNGYNLSCILVLPCYQQFGYGRFLIALSYLLTRRERPSLVSARRQLRGCGDVAANDCTENDVDLLVEPARGTPEVPLSEQGRRAYKAYWKQTISRYIVKQMIAGIQKEKEQKLPSDAESAVIMPKSDTDEIADDDQNVDADEDDVESGNGSSPVASDSPTFSGRRSRTKPTAVLSKTIKNLCCRISIRALQRATGMTLNDICETLIDMKLLKRLRPSMLALTNVDGECRSQQRSTAEVVIDTSKPRVFRMLLESAAARPATFSRKRGRPKHQHGRSFMAEKKNGLIANATVGSAGDAGAAVDEQQQQHYGRLILEEDCLHWDPPSPHSPSVNNTTSFGFVEQRSNGKKVVYGAKKI